MLRSGEGGCADDGYGGLMFDGEPLFSNASGAPDAAPVLELFEPEGNLSNADIDFDAGFALPLIPVDLAADQE